MEGEKEEEVQLNSSDEDEQKPAEVQKSADSEGYDEPDEHDIEKVAEGQNGAVNGEVAPQMNGGQQAPNVETVQKEEETVNKSAEVDTASETITQESSVKSNDAFSIRLPPPPGGLRRTESKRSRSSPSPTTSENNEAEIRLPPPPGPGAKSVIRRRSRKSSSSSSDDDDHERKEADFRLPHHPGSGSSEMNNNGTLSPASHEEVPAENNQQNDVSKPVLTATEYSNSNVSEPNGRGLPGMQNTGTKVMQEQLQSEEQTLDKQDADQSVGNTSHIQETVVPPETDEVQAGAMQKDDQLLLDFTITPDNKDKEVHSSDEFSGNEEPVGYSRLEKEDDDDESHDWANFNTNITGVKNGTTEISSEAQVNVESTDWAEFTSSNTSSKPSEEDGNQWADFAKSEETADNTEKPTETSEDNKDESDNKTPTTEL